MCALVDASNEQNGSSQIGENGAIHSQYYQRHVECHELGRSAICDTKSLFYWFPQFYASVAQAMPNSDMTEIRTRPTFRRKHNFLEMGSAKSRNFLPASSWRM
jgi:hypothetical protein